jgi:hypothetical protein
VVTEILADVGAIGTAVGVAFAGSQLVFNRRQSRTQFEDGLTSLYRELVAELPVEAFFKVEVPDEVVHARRAVFYRYFDLCNELAFLYEQNRISDNTWEQWKGGIAANMRRSAFSKAWLNEIEPYVDGDFREFVPLHEFWQGVSVGLLVKGS